MSECVAGAQHNTRIWLMEDWLLGQCGLPEWLVCFCIRLAAPQL